MNAARSKPDGVDSSDGKPACLSSAPRRLVRNISVRSVPGAFLGIAASSGVPSPADRLPINTIKSCLETDAEYGKQEVCREHEHLS
jgi:hypothetical protein